MSSFVADLRLAFRSLLRSPLLFAAAVVTLAISIGLGTAVFSVVDAVVLRPLPVADADRLLALCEADRGEQSDWCSASVLDIADVAARSRTLAVAGAARSWPFMMRTRTGAEGVRGGLATPEAFRALGVRALAGRLIEAGDAGTSWRRVVVLSNDVWRARFGAREDVIGQSLTIDDEPHTIVGILPPNTVIPRLEHVQMWRPLHFDPREEGRRDWRGFLAFARLKDGATVAEAQREVATIAAGIQRDHFPAKPGWSIRVERWQDVITGPVRGAMFLFLGAVGFLLLIGCANVANLLLARSTARQRELAVRAALGASTSRLASGALAEALVIALMGTALGVLVGWWASRLVVVLAPQGIPRIDEVGLDLRSVAFAAGLSIVATLLVGVAPAVRATRLDIRTTIGDGGRSGMGRHVRRLSAALIVGEIALAVILVTGAGLLGRSFAVLASWRPGFEQEHLMTTWLLASPGGFRTKRDVSSYFVRVVDEVRTIPSVRSVATASAGPLFGGDGEGNFTIDGRAAPEGSRQVALWYDISPGFFRTLGVPMMQGRDIEERDEDGAPLVAVVNESFVRRHLASLPPIGRTIHMAEHEADFTIVGVVKDVPPIDPGDPVPAQIFWSNRQLPRPASYLIVRTSGDPLSTAGALRTRLAAFDPTLQVSQVRTMKDWLADELVRPRFGAVLLGAFGLVALVLAAIGTYGLLAYLVAQETRQIGVRVALGARPSAIVREVLGRGMRLAGLAVALGLAGSLALTRLLDRLLAGVSPLDPISLGGSAAVLLLVAAFACVVPARRASHVDPLVALRAD